MKNKLIFVIMLTLPSLYNSMYQILTYDHSSNLRSPNSSTKINSSQNHENGTKHEASTIKNNNTQTDNINKFLDAIKQKIKNITKINNKLSTNSPTETSKVVKLNHQGELCAYCNSNYCNLKEENGKHWCLNMLKYCKNCEYC